MQLNSMALTRKELWEAADIALPKFDLESVKKQTYMQPTWIHFGAGNIFRVFPAAVLQLQLDSGAVQTGVIVAEGYDYEIIDKLFIPHDNLTLAVTLKADGTIEKRVIASVTEALKADSSNAVDYGRLKEIFRAPTLQMASFTITEKGYSLVRADGSMLPDVAQDFERGPALSTSYMGKVAALCYERYLAGALPIALVSMDNCSHNGDRLRDAVRAFAKAWLDNGYMDGGFLNYLDNPALVAFPWTMIDKITPRPDESVKDMLAAVGFEGAEGIVTSKNTFIASFVNAEETQWLIMEDTFPNGRPSLNGQGVMYAGRETVDKVEKMKVCTCLNPLHTALAVFGCLLGYTRICDEMKDADLLRLVEQVGYAEGLPVVIHPGILDPRKFIDNVIGVRLPNPFMPDTPQRIATDTSQKLSIRFGETIKAYLRDPKLDVNSLHAIPLVLAGWCRYLMGIDDNGASFALSPDPQLERLREQLGGITLGGNAAEHHRILEPILSDATLFGVNLYDAGLGEQVEMLFSDMAGETGAVRKVLQAL